jgi:thermitase
MKWISLLALIPSFAFALPVAPGEHFRMHLNNEYVVSGSFDKSAASIVKRIGKNFYIVRSTDQSFIQSENVHPNYTYFGNFMETASNDPMLSEQFHHTQISTFNAWTTTRGDQDLIVAVTDNEFELDHDDLKNQWWKNEAEIEGNGIDDDGNGYIDDIYGWDFMGEDNNTDVTNGVTHGTHVAGIIAAEANNGIGIAGVAPNVKVMPLRWYGNERSWTSAIVAETYRYAVDNGAKIINTSYNIDYLVDDQVYLDAVKYVNSKGAIIFNSAGNNSKKNPPRQKVEDIVLVCSVKSKDDRKVDRKSSFSNYGTGIDICAPGDPVYSAVQGRYEGKSRYGKLEGTSMAAPVAAGVAALIWSHNPNFSRQEVIAKLLESADNIDEVNKKRFRGLLGAGRVNASKAMR